MKNLLHILNGVLAVLGRALLCVTILGALCYTAPGLKGLSQGISTAGAVSSRWAFIVAIAILVVGVASVIVGYRARIEWLARRLF